MFKTGHGVNFCLLRDTHVLLQQRDENCPYFPLQWCIPGGATNAGESDIATVIREAAEEYGVTLTESDCTFLTTRPAHNPGSVYVCNLKKDAVPKCNEGKDMKWVAVKDLHATKLAFGHNDFITPALQNLQI